MDYNRYLYEIIVIVSVSLFFCPRGISQQQDFQIIQYDLNDGLPSNECYEIDQDSLGYIWIATDRGLSRFDGDQFKNYGTDKGLKNISCLELERDDKDNYYLSTFGGKIFYLDRKIDRIFPYEHQDILESFPGKNKRFELIDEDAVHHLTINKKKLLRIYPNGEYLLTDSNYAIPTYELNKVGNKGYAYVDYPEKSEEEFIRFTHDNIPVVPFAIHYNGADTLINTQGSRNGSFKYSIIDSAYSVLSLSDSMYLFKNEKLCIKRPENLVIDILKTKEGKILASMFNSGGLRIYNSIEDFLKNNYKVILSGKSLTRLLEDRENQIWIGSTDNGVYLLRQSGIFYPEDEILANEPILDVTADNEGNLYLSMDRSHIYHYKYPQDEKILLKELIGNRITDIEFDNTNQKVVLVGDKSYGHLSKDGSYTSLSLWNKNLEYPEVVRSKYADILPDGRLFIHHNKIAVIYNKRDSLPVLQYHDLFDYRKYDIRVFLPTDDKTAYFGNVDGFYKLKNGKIDTLNECPDLNYRITDIAKLKDKYLISTLGNGLVWWQNDSCQSTIKFNQGLISDNIEKLRIYGDTICFAMSKQGLSLIKLQNNHIKKIVNLDTNNGLKSSVVHDVVPDRNHGWWLATDRGLAHWTGFFPEGQKFQPLIEHVKVNGQASEGNRYEHNKNNISILYKCLELKNNGRIRYRHRLNGNKWTEEKNTSIQYSNLKPGNYLFEVQAQNVNKIWSPSTQYKFVVMKPWWDTWWFKLLFILVLSFAFFAFYWQKISAINQERQYVDKINQMRLTTIHNQISPHFIYNCLNSIQSFIYKNEKEEAVSFLSKFAYLTRKVLNSLSDQKINLLEEKQLIQNYLSLEQLRLNYSFGFTFNIDEISDPESITIPSLVIQPVVENAIKHAMNYRKEGGMINITLTCDHSFVYAVVKDNGNGLFDYSSRPHKKRSFGLDLTRQMLGFVNEVEDEDNIRVIPTHHGTTVYIKLKILR